MLEDSLQSKASIKILHKDYITYAGAEMVSCAFTISGKGFV